MLLLTLIRRGGNGDLMLVRRTARLLAIMNRTLSFQIVHGIMTILGCERVHVVLFSQALVQTTATV